MASANDYISMIQNMGVNPAAMAVIAPRINEAHSQVQAREALASVGVTGGLAHALHEAVSQVAPAVMPTNQELLGR